MRILISAIALTVAAGCATAPVLDTPAIRVEVGEQLRPWGVELHPDGKHYKVDGYVTHVRSARMQLEEHVHIEVVGSDGVAVQTDEAQVSIRSNHTNDAAIPLHARVPVDAVSPGSVIVVRVVRNTGDDRGA